MNTLQAILNDIDYLQNGAGRAIGHEPSADDLLNLLRRLCNEVKRIDTKEIPNEPTTSY